MKNIKMKNIREIAEEIKDELDCNRHLRGYQARVEAIEDILNKYFGEKIKNELP